MSAKHGRQHWTCALEPATPPPPAIDLAKKPGAQSPGPTNLSLQSHQSARSLPVSECAEHVRPCEQRRRRLREACGGAARGALAAWKVGEHEQNELGS